MLEIKLRQSGNCIILDLDGQIDVDSANLVEVAGQCVRDGYLKMKLAPKPEVLELEARVVWVPDKAVQPHEYPGIGVEFSNLSTENQQKIIEFIDRNISLSPLD